MSDIAKQSAGALSGDFYKRLAQLLVIFPGACADAGCPLTEKQECLLNEIALLTFDGTEASLVEMLTIEHDVRFADQPLHKRLGWQPDVRSWRPYDPECGR